MTDNKKGDAIILVADDLKDTKQVLEGLFRYQIFLKIVSAEDQSFTDLQTYNLKPTLVDDLKKHRCLSEELLDATCPIYVKYFSQLWIVKKPFK